MANSGDWLRIGPWGGLRHGYSFDYNPNGHITLIVVRHGECVHSISFQSVCEDRKYHHKFGGAGGNTKDKVNLDVPDEYITCLNVTFNDIERENVISSFGFSTNLTTYGPFGKISESKFSIPVEGGPIVGFHGRAWKYLNAIGVYAMPKSLLQKNVKRVETFSDVSVDRLWGGREGRPWDDGVYVAVSTVCVQIGCFGTDSTHLVTSVRFMYVKDDGSFVWSPEYGKYNFDYADSVTINCSKEALIGVEGFYGKLCSGDSYDKITSLTFHTKAKKYGPYGEEIGIYFSSNLSGGKVVGFFGRSGQYLNAIGVHLKQE